MEALSYNPEGSSFSYGTQSQALVPYSAPHTSTHYEPSLSYVTTAHQMLPQQLSSHYDSSMPPPPPPPPLPTRKRPRSGSIDDSERHWDRDIRMQQLYPAFSNERSVTLPELPGILYSGHSDYAPSHSTPGPELPPRMNLPRPQQHHHHYLPPQTLLHPDPHGLRPDTHYESSEHANIVDQPGMPAPTPKPTKPKTLFTPEENKKIKYLKEVKRLTWPQIMQFFPGRSTGTLQVRYSKRLKDRDVNWTDRLIQRLRREMDEYNANIWDVVSRKLGDNITANVCKMKAIELGWATPDPENDFEFLDNPTTTNTPNPGEQDNPIEPAKSGARGRGRGKGKGKVNQSA